MVLIVPLLLILILSACNETVQEVESKKEKPKGEKVLEYDELQRLYLDLDKSITYDELINKLEGSSLFFSEFKGNSKSIKIAFREEVTPFRHAESGDYIEVSFSDDLTFDYATYFNHDIFITLLHYENGTYYSFKDQPNYAGYYINTYMDKAGSFKIKYSNGNETEVDYLKVDSKEAQFKYMYEYAKKKK